MKKHYYYLLVEASTGDCLIIKAYNKSDIKNHAFNVSNIQGRYAHYNEAKEVALKYASKDFISGDLMIRYTSLTGVDYVD